MKEIEYLKLSELVGKLDCAQDCCGCPEVEEVLAELEAFLRRVKVDKE